MDLRQFWDDVSQGYERHIVDEHKQAHVFILLAFLLTFSIVRVITHAIRAGKWKRVLRNVGTKGGTHVHHLVPGIILLLVSGYLGAGLPPDVRREPVAILFGIGAALTLDEFALWLHLEDVYWAKQGRQSIDAVVVMATLAGLGVLGSAFWVDIARAAGRAIGVS
jgi:hypothetical protein